MVWLTIRLPNIFMTCIPNTTQNYICKLLYMHHPVVFVRKKKTQKEAVLKAWGKTKTVNITHETACFIIPYFSTFSIRTKSKKATRRSFIYSVILKYSLSKTWCTCVQKIILKNHQNHHKLRGQSNSPETCSLLQDSDDCGLWKRCCGHDSQTWQSVLQMIWCHL